MGKPTTTSEVRNRERMGKPKPPNPNSSPYKSTQNPNYSPSRNPPTITQPKPTLPPVTPIKTTKTLPPHPSTKPYRLLFSRLLRRELGRPLSSRRFQEILPPSQSNGSSRREEPAKIKTRFQEILPRSQSNWSLVSSASPVSASPVSSAKPVKEGRSVVTAFGCNVFVFGIKCLGYYVTSSQVMLAEALHSAADVGNQSSRRNGYSKGIYVWCLISAVGVFCFGSVGSILIGIQHLWIDECPDDIRWGAIVIATSFLFEGYSLRAAIVEVRKGAASKGISVRDYIRSNHNPTTISVLAEDAAAVGGLVVASATLMMVAITGSGAYDAVGSMIVGVIMGKVAFFLIQRNRHALLGTKWDSNDPIVMIQGRHAKKKSRRKYTAFLIKRMVL